MKAIINNNSKSKIDLNWRGNYLGHEEKIKDIKVVDYLAKGEKGQLTISLYSELFSGSELKVFVRDNKVIIAVSEYMNSNRNAAMYVNDWESYYQQSYIKEHNVSVLLPGDNFYLLRYFLVPEKNLLNISLGQVIEN